MYFRVESPEHSMRIQRELTNLGYKWNFPGGDKPNQDMANRKDPYLYTTSSGDIFRTDDRRHVLLYYTYPEYKLDNLGYITSVSGVETSPYIADHNSEAIPVTADRPPLGLKPRKLHDESRLKEILAAMTRYAEAGEEIPEKWIIELATVNKGAQTPI